MTNRIRVVVVCAIVWGSTLWAQTQEPGPRRQDHFVYVPYWTVSEGFDSIAHLRNNLVHDALEVTPITLSPAGEKRAGQSLTVPPQGNASIDIRSLLSQQAGSAPTWGSIGFKYNSRTPGALMAEVSVTNEKLSLVYTVIGASAGPNASEQHAIFWLPTKRTEVYVAFLNASEREVRVSPRILLNGRSIALAQVVMPPKSTRVLELPDDLPGLPDVRQLLSDRGAVGGMTISHDGSPGAIISSGWLEDEVSGFSTMMTFHDASTSQAARLMGTQVLLGEQDLQGGSNFHVDSYLTLRNLAPQTVTLRTDVFYEEGGNVKSLPLNVPPLSPLEIRLIPLSDLRSSGLPRSVRNVSLRVDYDAAPGYVMGRVFGVTPNKKLGLYWSLDANAARSYNELHWSVTDGWNTILTVANVGDTPDTVSIVATHPTGTAIIGTPVLQPWQSITIDVAKAVSAIGGVGVSGGFKITGGSKTSRILVKEHLINAAKGYATPFYGYYDYVTSFYVGGSLLDETYTLGYSFPTTLYWSNGTSEADCGWVGSRDTSIVTVSKSYYWCDNTIRPVAAGSTFVDAQSESVPLNSQGQTGMLFAFAQARVRKPNSVSYISTNVQGAAVCAAGSAGFSRTVVLELRADDGQPYRQPGITMSDAISPQATNNLGIQSTTTGSTSTNAQGRWNDTYFVCSTACPASTGRTDAVQSWTWNNKPLPNANFIVYRCNSITVDGR